MLEYRADLHRELELALNATIQADADALSGVRLDLRDALDVTAIGQTGPSVHSLL